MEDAIRRLYIFLFSLIFSIQAFTSEEEKYYLPEPVRIVMKYMLNASQAVDSEKVQNFSDALTVLGKYEAMPAEKVVVTSLSEYIQLRYDRNRYAVLDFEVDHLNQLRGLKKYDYHFESESVRNEVHEYHVRQQAFISEYIEPLKAELQKENVDFSTRAAINAVVDFAIKAEDPTERSENSRFLAQAITFANTLDRDKKLQIINGFEELFSKLEEQIRNIGDAVAGNREQFKVENKRLQGAGRFIQLLLHEVFRNETKAGIKNIISGFLDNPSIGDDLGRFSYALNYSIPQLLKLLQLVARMEGLGPEFQAIFQRFESDGRAAHPELIKDIVEKDRQRLSEHGIELVSFDSKAVNAGTIAQIHLAKVWMNGGERTVVLRVIKPGMVDMIARGEKIMNKAAYTVDSDPELTEKNWPKLGPQISQLTENIYADIDTKGGAKRQQQGKLLYSHTFTHKVKDARKRATGLLRSPNRKVVVEYAVPEVYYFNDTEEYKLMVMEAVEGQKLEKFKDKFPNEAPLIAKGAVNRWLREALITSGFFHGDLHFGNFLVQALERTPKESRYRVNILDYGMGDTLPLRVRTYFVGLIGAMKLNEIGLMKEMLWGVRNKEETKITEAEFDLLLLGKIKRNDIKVPEEWISWAIEKGVVLPKQIVDLSRGIGIVLLHSMRYDLSEGLTGLLANLIKSEPKVVLDILRGSLVPKKAIARGVGRKVKEKVTGRSNFAISPEALTCKHFFSRNLN